MLSRQRSITSQTQHHTMDGTECAQQSASLCHHKAASAFHQCCGCSDQRYTDTQVRQCCGCSDQKCTDTKVRQCCGCSEQKYTDTKVRQLHTSPLSTYIAKRRVRVPMVLDVMSTVIPSAYSNMTLNQNLMTPLISIESIH